MHAKFLSYRKFTKSNLSAERTGQVLSTLTSLADTRANGVADVIIQTQPSQRNDNGAISSRFAHAPALILYPAHRLN